MQNIQGLNFKQEIGKYFGKTVSGFVANKFIAKISAFDEKNLSISYRFYVKRVTIPYQTLTFTDDIYVCPKSLARPRNVLSVSSHNEITVLFRMDPKHEIMNILETLFESTHTLRTFEASKPTLLFVFTLDIYDSISSNTPVKTYTLENCVLTEMTGYTLDYSDTKLKEYEATFYSTLTHITTPVDTAAKPDPVTPSMQKVTQVKPPSKRCTDAFNRYQRSFNDVRRSTDRMGGQRRASEYFNAMHVAGVFEAYENVLKVCPNLNIKTPLDLLGGVSVNDVGLELRKLVISEQNKIHNSVATQLRN